MGADRCCIELLTLACIVQPVAETANKPHTISDAGVLSASEHYKGL